jgi:DNA-binding CsgD family transcriptional regulator
MLNKSTQKKSGSQIHRPPAGIFPGDFGTEIFGRRHDRKVFALCNGINIPFNQINPVLRARIYEMMLNDPQAIADLKHLPYDEALEEFAFCVFGQLDHNPDFNPDGSLGQPENFICGGDCNCQNWKSKAMTLNGHKLTPREIEVAQHLATDSPDKAIAHRLNMAEHTLVTHKRNLYNKAGVQSKSGFTRKAITQKVVQ